MIYQMNQYNMRMAKVASLNFSLLDVNLKHFNAINNQLSVSNLNKDYKLELCKLMSRSAGRINHFKMFGIGSDLRESSSSLEEKRRHENIIRDTIDFNRLKLPGNNQIDFFLSNFNKLTMAEAYIIYKMFQNRLTLPYRKLEVYHIRKIFI